MIPTFYLLKGGIKQFPIMSTRFKRIQSSTISAEPLLITMMQKFAREIKAEII